MAETPAIPANDGVNENILAYCLRGFHEDEKAHDIWCHKVERNYRAWRAILERRSDAMGWTNKQRPALVYQAIDTLLAGLLVGIAWAAIRHFRAPAAAHA